MDDQDNIIEELDVAEAKAAEVTIPNSDIIRVDFTTEEILTLVQLLYAASTVFDTMAITAVQTNDEMQYMSQAARKKLSKLFGDKLLQFAQIGEPTSRVFH